MAPKDDQQTPRQGLFRMEMPNPINPRYPLGRLAARFDLSLFGHDWVGLSALPATGRPAAPLRLIISLLDLPHTYNLSDEAVLDRGLESTYFQHNLRTDPSSMTRWRPRAGEERVEGLLALMIETTRHADQIKRQRLKPIAVNTTFHEKPFTYPPPATLYARAIRNPSNAPRPSEMPPRQSSRCYIRETLLQVDRDAQAKQIERKRRVTPQLKTYLRWLTRNLKCKVVDALAPQPPPFGPSLARHGSFLTKRGTIRTSSSPRMPRRWNSSAKAK